MKQMLIVLFGIGLILSAPVYSVDAGIDIRKALFLASKEKYEESLVILAPCVKTTLKTAYINIEECLYHGEEISEDATRSLVIRYQDENKLTPTGSDFEHWLGKMGIKVSYGYEGWPTYNHNYIKHLIHLFPNSKYRDVYDYKILERGVNNIQSVQKWIDSLISYRSKYPSGRYLVNATEDLANAYDDLWEILTPDPKWGYSEYYHFFSSGNKETDKNNAETYRNEALKLYEELNDPRYKMLKARIPSNSFYILND